MKTTTGRKEPQRKPQKQQYHRMLRSNFVLCILWFVTTLYVSAYVGARRLRANLPMDRHLPGRDEPLTVSSHANDRDDDAKDRVSSVRMGMGMDSCFVAGRGETIYRFPTKTLTQENIPDSPEAPAVVAGVLSVASKPHERQTIRSTWAYNRTNVFFLVAGNFTPQLQQEFHQHNDIIHVEAPETYRDVTVKVMVLFSAVAKYLPDAMVIKTDTDTYVRMAEMESIAKQRYGQTLYMGKGCDSRIKHPVRRKESPWYVSKDVYRNSTYPSYALGGGYLLSHHAVACAVEQNRLRTKDREVFPIEDAFTGILLSQCPNIECESASAFLAGSAYPLPKFTATDIARRRLLHQVKDHNTMVLMHREVCCNTENKRLRMDPWSCAAVDCPHDYASPPQNEQSTPKKKQRINEKAI